MIFCLHGPLISNQVFYILLHLIFALFIQRGISIAVVERFPTSLVVLRCFELIPGNLINTPALLTLFQIEDITWPLGDTNFIFSC